MPNEIKLIKSVSII